MEILMDHQYGGSYISTTTATAHDERDQRRGTSEYTNVSQLQDKPSFGGTDF